MVRELDQDELIDRWTLVGRAGFGGQQALSDEAEVHVVAVLLHRAGSLSRGRGELPDAAIDYVARQVGVQAAGLAFYGWSRRTIEFHRSQIRGVLGFRECSVSDADKLADWLIVNVTQEERGVDRVRVELLARAWPRDRATHGRPLDRIVRSALHRGEELLVTRVIAYLPRGGARSAACPGRGGRSR